ncbi:hypothetical protein ARMSODRAFT_663098 [Armillaria solidipes]|uniref:Uncharacterized protein n=1 Tax=Armillaria solidipes TaxID=1076256 RepID=A0A2H3AS15_9AGAR|nr:hypothetical protein ARMSODRAFT_663098 [Armillaria solidipes]
MFSSFDSTNKMRPTRIPGHFFLYLSPLDVAMRRPMDLARTDLATIRSSQCIFTRQIVSIPNKARRRIHYLRCQLGFCTSLYVDILSFNDGFPPSLRDSFNCISLYCNSNASKSSFYIVSGRMKMHDTDCNSTSCRRVVHSTAMRPLSRP